MDRINMNVFRQIREQKHGTANKANNIYAKPKKDPNKKFTRPTGQYTMGDDNYMAPSTKKALPGGTGKSSTQGIANFNDDNTDLYYANPNNYNVDLTTKTTVNKNGVVTRTNGSGITTIQAMVKNPKNPDKPEMWQYKVRTQKVEDPDLEIDNQKLQAKRNQMTKEEKQMAKMQAKVLINTVKNNRLTYGVSQMMENERLHAQEAIESGIYVTWTSLPKDACFRVGSNSVCFCGHGFREHDCIVNAKKYSSKCHSCKCKDFKWVPQFPEEIGEYWIPYQKGFSYETWKPKCKCKHTVTEHSGDGYLNCKKCGCGAFASAFCCAVCNKFWQDHETKFELEKERIAEGKAVREDFIPFNELPEMYDALYK